MKQPHCHSTLKTLALPRRQKGAALLIVVIIFLLVLPLLIAIFMQHTLEGTTMGVSSGVRSSAADAGNRALAALRPQIDAALSNGLLEYQSTPPAWFIPAGETVDTRSAGFWETCKDKNLCVQSTLGQPIGTTTTKFTVSELVTPTGVTDPTICGQDGFVAVFYDIFIHTQASNIPADGGHTIQSVYRTCQSFRG